MTWERVDSKGRADLLCDGQPVGYALTARGGWDSYYQPDPDLPPVLVARGERNRRDALDHLRAVHDRRLTTQEVS